MHIYIWSKQYEIFTRTYLHREDRTDKRYAYIVTLNIRYYLQFILRKLKRTREVLKNYTMHKEYTPNFLTTMKVMIVNSIQKGKDTN